MPYFNRDSLISLALFKKDLDSFVQTKQITSVFHNNAFGIPDSVAVAACNGQTGCDVATTPLDPTWCRSTPRGGPDPKASKSTVHQQAFTFPAGKLPASHTGALINYARADRSSIQYINGTGVVVATNDLTGLSRESYNATLYYEDERDQHPHLRRCLSQQVPDPRPGPGSRAPTWTAPTRPSIWTPRSSTPGTST